MKASAILASADEHRRDERPLSPDAQFGDATPGKIGMWVFLLSDASMFAGLLFAYGVLRSGSEVWRPAAQPELGISFTAGLTLLLVCSSVTMARAHAALSGGHRQRAVRLLLLTALGGSLFLCGQYHEWFGIGHPGLSERGLDFGSSAYASTFYVVTGFHGAHVFSGVVLLLLTALSTTRGKATAHDVETVGLFWHFVDLIWILVFTLIYLIVE
jgi:heme/copper-type cytochrome/quinol oxidase subunit 3